MNDDILDFDEFKDRVQDDMELLLELLDIYEEDYQLKRVGLGEAIASGNADEVRNIAHSLKGASGNISAKQVRDSFYKLEEMGKNGNLDGAEVILSKVDEDYQALSQRFADLRKDFK